MTKPLTFDGETHREMTDAEYEQWRTDAAASQQAAELAAETRRSALAKLAALGLTEAEITALVG